MATGKVTTSNMGKFRDLTPHLVAAGKVLTDPGDGAEACLRTYGARPETPDHMKMYRKSYTHQPGVSHKHPGRFRDPNPPDVRFGMKSDNSETAASLVHPEQGSAWSSRQREFKEQNYLSNKSEPVGKSKQHGYNLPDRVKDPNFRFGCNVKETFEDQRARGNEAKFAIYPVDEPQGQEREKKKKFDWDLYPQVDPLSHRFGFKPVEVNTGGASAALRPDDDDSGKTSIVRKAVEDFRDRVTDELAKPKKQWGITAHLPSDYTFGKALKVDKDWGARECLRGAAQQRPVNEEETLGKSGNKTILRAKQTSPTVDPNRVFGVPTIRNDRAKPARKRVTETQNWGDECDAGGLLYPSRYAGLNVHEEDFMKPVTQDFMHNLCGKAGYDLPDQDFESAWNLAASNSSDGSVCIRSFQMAMCELALGNA